MKPLPPIVLLTLLLAGCGGGAGTNTAEFALDPDGPPARPVVDTVITDKSLDRIARVVDARQAFGRGTVPQVQVTVRNTTARRQRFVYQFVWLDGGFAVDTNKTRAQEVDIGPRATRVLRGSAPSREVEGWRLVLSRAD